MSLRKRGNIPLQVSQLKVKRTGNKDNEIKEKVWESRVNVQLFLMRAFFS